MVDMFFVFFFSRVAHDIQMRYIDIFSMKKLSFYSDQTLNPQNWSTINTSQIFMEFHLADR